MDSPVDSDEVTKLTDPLLIRAGARLGRVIRERWRLDSLLGVGGMAAVYAATHRNGSRVALKVLHAELSINAQVRSRFLREGYVANAVGHDGAVKVLDDDTAEDGSLFLVTELLDGETVEDRRLRSGGTLTEDETLWIADQLLDVLAAAHARGIVHRDLKPENLFLTRDSRVKVLDFGIARLREVTSASTATRSGASMGTPAFMPPEQARGLWDEVDARTDLWAVGATMFHLLSGKLVHEGRSANEVLLAAMTKPAPPLATIAPSITPAVCHLVDHALSFERESRWLDAQRMQERLRSAYHDRFGMPITTARRLTVPDTVPNRTLPCADVAAIAPRLPTTGQPVAGSLNVGVGPVSGRMLAALVFGGAVTIGVMVSVAVVFALARGGTHAPSGTSSAITAPTSSGAAVTSAEPIAVPSASAPPAVDVATLPSADPSPPPTTATTGRTRRSPGRAVPARPATPPPSPTKPPCPRNPDGTVRWGADCDG